MIARVRWSGVEALLERARGREFRRLACRDADRLACGWIASQPGRAVADAELTEASKRDLPSGSQLVGDHLDRALQHLPSLAGGQPVSPPHFLGYLGLGHSTP